MWRPLLVPALVFLASAPVMAQLVDSDATCTAGSIEPHCVAEAMDQAHNVAFPMSLIWPPTAKTLPNLAILTIAAWSVVAIAMLNKESDAEKEHQHKRAMQVLAQLAQTHYEHTESSKKWKKYEDRKAAFRDKAKEQSLKSTETEEDIYQQLIVETGFASEDPPEAALDPKRVFEVLIDEVDDCHVVKLKDIEERLGAEKCEELKDYFNKVREILKERLLDKLGKILSKTRAGYENDKDPRFKSFSTGVKLLEVIELGKNVSKQFYPASLFGLVKPCAPDGDDVGKELLSKLREAKSLMKDIKKRQPSRLTQILSFFETQTFVYMGLASLTRVFGGAIGPLRGFLFNMVVVNASQENWQPLVRYNLLCIGMVFFLDWYVNDWVSMVAQTKATSLMKHALRTKIFDAVLRQDSEYFEQHDGSEICDRVQHDVNTVADHAIYIPMDIIGILSSMGWHIVLMRSFCPGMVFRTLCIGAVIAPIFMVLNRLTNRLRRKDDRTMRAINSNTSEMLQKVKTVREFSREGQEAAELDRGARVMTRSMIFLHIMGHLQHMAIFTLLTGGEVSNYWYGASLVNQKELDPVKLIQVGGIVYHITFMLKHLMEQVPRFMRIMIPAGRIFELLESKSLIEPMPGDILPVFQKKNGGIELEFRDVSFAYPLMPEVTVLRHCNLTIPAGKTVAICGERAAGKSTLYAVMQRMYDVEYGMGQIIVNDHPLQYWDVRSYRKNISILAQKGLLFKGTIKENLLYGLSEEEKRSRGFHLPEGDKELQRLLEISGAWDIIKEFPLKIEQRIGTGGVTLSGGTEQCIFIARGLVKEPAMMMLDEATSAMDTHTQKKAANGIRAEQERLGFSVVQVAHRIETLTGADVLYFVEHGQVVEVGGLNSLNGTAIDELISREITYETVPNPETGAEMQVLKTGFYRQLHEAYYDLDFRTMGLPQLLNKVRSLETQLARAKQEKGAKLETALEKWSQSEAKRRNSGKEDDYLDATKPLPPLVLDRAVTHPVASCRQSEGSDCGSTTTPASLDANTDSVAPDITKIEPIASGIIASLLGPLTVERATTSPAA
jgi:ABC-type multidrug transport system fused ATPase/permease subunit